MVKTSSAKQYVAPISSSLRTITQCQSDRHISIDDSSGSTNNRTIDDYYSLAYADGSSTFQFRYWLMFLILGLAQASDAIEANLMNFLLASEEFKNDILLNDLKGNGAMLAASCYGGMLVGGIVNGAYGDQLGRRPTLLTGLLMVSTASITSVFVPNVQVFCVLEFISGVGIGTLIPSITAIATEAAPSTHRGMFVTFVTSFWTVGTIYMALIAFMMFGLNKMSWRLLILVSTIPSVSALILAYFFVPESARYLASQGNTKAATKAANRVAKSMNSSLTYLREEEINYYHNKHTQSSSYTMGDLTLKAIDNFKYVYGTVLRPSTLTLQFLWIMLSAGQGLCTWINTLFVKLHMDYIYLHCLLFALANIPGNIFAGLLIDKIGRKILITASMLLASVSLDLFAFEAAKVDTNDFLITISACLFHTFLIVALCAQSVITGETFPTLVRNTGMGVCLASGRIGALSLQYVSGGLSDNPSLLLYIVSIIVAIGSIAPWLLKQDDMSNMSLSDDGGLSSFNHIQSSAVRLGKLT